MALVLHMDQGVWAHVIYLADTDLLFTGSFDFNDNLPDMFS